MAESDIKEIVWEIVRPYSRRGPAAGRVDGSASLVDDLGVDSGRFVEIVLGLETRFQMTVEDAAIECLRTVDDIVAYVDRRRGS